MKQSSSLTRNLAQAQELHALKSTSAPAFNATKTLYRLFTQWLPNLDASAVVSRYFAGATLTRGIGLDARALDGQENALIIEIVSSASDALQKVLNLAGDLRVLGGQVSVLVTVQEIRTFEVTEAEPHRIAGHRALDRATDSPRFNRGSKAQAHRFADVG